MATLLLEIVTPDKTILKEEVDSVVCPGVEGEFGVLPHHISLLSALKLGPLVYKQQGKEVTVFISGGFLEMNNNKCNVLAEAAEKASDINVQRAEEAKRRAEERLKGKKEQIDAIRANIALKRSIMRLKLSGR